MRQSPEDLRRHLDEQIGFLQVSADNFDLGNLAEGKRIATVVRVLCHTTTASSALLDQLALLDRPFYSTASSYSPTNMVSHHPLVIVALGGGRACYRVPLDDCPADFVRWVPFAEWWTVQTVVAAPGGPAFSRSNLVRDVANMDGGAHVDSELREPYASLSRRNLAGWSAGDGSSLGALELFSLRQIGHEILTTLRRALSGDQSKYVLEEEATRQRAEFSRRAHECVNYGWRLFEDAGIKSPRAMIPTKIGDIVFSIKGLDAPEALLDSIRNFCRSQDVGVRFTA